MQFKAIIVAAFASSVAAQSLDPNLLSSVSSALGASAFNSILQNLPAELSSAKAGQIPSWVSQLPPALQSSLASQFGISFSAPVTASGSSMTMSGSASASETGKMSSAMASMSSMMASMSASHSGSGSATMTGSMMTSGTGASSSPTSSSGAAPTGLIGAGLAGAAGLIGLLAL